MTAKKDWRTRCKNVMRQLGRPRPCTLFAKLTAAFFALPAVLFDHGLQTFSGRTILLRRTLENTDYSRFDKLSLLACVVRGPLRLAVGVRDYGGILPVLWTKRQHVRAMAVFIKKSVTSPSSVPGSIAILRENGFIRGLEEVTGTLIVWDAPPFELKNAEKVGIVSTNHCLFIAKLLVKQLHAMGFKTEIMTETPQDGYEDIPHFVICPQMFTELPAQYVAFQMEQSVHSRWFTDSYFNKLHRASAVFDYSMDNIAFLLDHELSMKNVYLMPVGFLDDGRTELPQKDIDILFYGDDHCPRRQTFLQKLESRFTVKRVNNLFGDDMRDVLRRSKIVVNIHYYEGALLETTRIHEALSEDCLVISERATDDARHADLNGIVEFVAIDDADAMCDAVGYWLEDDSRLQQRLTDNRKALRDAPDWFQFYFMRFLLAHEIIDFETFCTTAGHNIRFQGNRVCLGLPESLERYESFHSHNPFGFEYFPGLRHTTGWLGAGMSHRFILRRLLELGCDTAMVCEDDVEFYPGCEERLAIALDYLHQNEGKWDIFSGINADVSPETTILHVEKFNGETFVTTNRTVSAVFNIFTKDFCRRMQDWSPANTDVSNTIDRFMESLDSVTVVSILPYLVGHTEDLKSTVWNFQNSTYTSMIENSGNLLAQKVEEWKAERGNE